MGRPADIRTANTLVGCLRVLGGRTGVEPVGCSPVPGGFLEGVGAGDPPRVEDESGGAVQGRGPTRRQSVDGSDRAVTDHARPSVASGPRGGRAGSARPPSGLNSAATGPFPSCADGGSGLATRLNAGDMGAGSVA